MSGELALETIEAVADAKLIGIEIGQQVKRVLARHLQILRAVLVVDRKGFFRLTPQ